MKSVFDVEHAHNCECTKCSGTPKQSVDAVMFVAGTNVFYLKAVKYEKGNWMCHYSAWYMSDGRQDRGSMPLSQWNGGVEKWMEANQLDHFMENTD